MHPYLLLSLGILAAAGTATAQDPDSPSNQIHPQTPAVFGQEDVALLPPGGASTGLRLQGLRTAIHTMAADLGNAYGTWAAGDDYKVSFHDGMTFVPYLGQDYPQNQPFSWQTRSAKVGNVELVETTSPTVDHGDYRYEYRFGGITEAYDVRSDGLEQSFVLDRRPQASGDLVIRGAVNSLLKSRNTTAAHQALTFADADGHDLVTYGEAFAIDANGDRIDVLTGHADGVITLTVPGSWLAKASFPVVVDPLIGRVTTATWGTAGTGQPSGVDIGRDDVALTSNMMVTYTRWASASDGDMWARLYNEDYTNNTMAFSDITASWSTESPRCAFVGGTSKWAVTFCRYFASQGLRQVRAHVHASGDTTASTVYASLVPPSQSNDWRPDVGGVDAFAVGNSALMVFQREDNTPTTGSFSNVTTSEIHGVLIDTSTANGTFGTTFLVYSGTTSDCERPSVNQVAEGGSAFSWVTVCQVYNNSISNDDWDLIGRRVDNTGAVATGSFISNLAVGTPTLHQLGPVVEGQGGRYAVVFTTADTAVINFKTGLITGYDLYTERFDWANTASSPTVKPAVHMRGNTTRIWESTGCAYDTNDDSHWAIGFRAVSPGTPTAYYGVVGYNGRATQGPVGTILYSVSTDTPTEVACTYNNDTGNFHFAYGVDDGTATQPIFGDTLTYNAPTPYSNSGTSCSTESIYWSGNQQIGAEFNRLYISGAPANAVHIPLMSLGSVDALLLNPSVQVGCRILINPSAGPYLGQLPLSIGSSASYQIALPETLPNTTVYLQDWFLDPATLLFRSSVRLTVNFVK